MLMNLKNIFNYMDNLPSKVGDTELGFWKYPEETRKSILIVGVLFPGLMWVIQGFDSGIGEYGTSMHWSWFVIYGLAYIRISKGLDMEGSKNIFYSLMGVIMAFSLFELYWSTGYFLFYRQDWVITENPIIFTCLFMFLFTSPTLAPITDTKWYHLLWFLPSIYWLLIGFPQTCYPQADGTINYIENNLIHALNLISKATFTLAITEPLAREGMGFIKASIRGIIGAFLNKIVGV